MAKSTLSREVTEDISAFYRKMKASFYQMVREKGMTLPRARALYALGKREGINQRELAESLEIETPTLVRILDSLEAQGFLERRQADADRRAKEVYLLPAGREVAAEVDEVARTMREKIVEGISAEELTAMLRTVRAMTANLQKLGKE
ncbi:MarR family transcriptional regulator [Rhizobium sp. BK251]|uniref:MarR family winged helix-turn-helix transcriptional regulator n=1 Tax=Rhizobium sp. BK251 TaxID=2512125 RepID=UPI00104671F2|nr:MarR family transcriptional regulator [Rhizobium sp. BK251]TCL70221.1 MarR family transcriptional regulator for hemolysin [Rhizobium sp. BK251]